MQYNEAKIKAYALIEEMIKKAKYKKEEIEFEVQRLFGLNTKVTYDYIEKLIGFGKAKIMPDFEIIIPTKNTITNDSYYTKNEMEEDTDGNGKENRSENKL
jgi:hypothetical protein